MGRWRHALRNLRRAPAFTLAVTVSLALGIGANTAMFTLADALFLREIGVRNPDQLLRIASDTGPGDTPGAILSPLAGLIEREHIFDGVCGFLSPLSTVRLDGRVTQMASHAMTGRCFSTLGVSTVLGRPLTEDDDRAAADRVVVLAYDTWRRDFGGDPAVIGRTMQIENGMFTIVGVAERGFTGLMVGYPEKIFIPFAHFELAADTPARPLLPMEVFARLPKNTTAAHVVGRLNTLWPRFLESSVPEQFTGAVRERYMKRRLIITEAATGIDYSLRSRFRGPLIALLAISAIVLLVTCVNVANLLLARAAERRHASAVRTALGAPRWDLAADAMTESAILVLLGATAGMLAAFWTDRLLVAIFSANAATFALDVSPNLRVLAFTGVISALAFALFAIVPALANRRVDNAALSSASTRVVGRRDRLRPIAVVAQLALTLVLAAAGGAFFDELRRLKTEPLGLSLDPVLSAQLSPIPGGYQPPFNGGTYFRDLLDRIGAIRGVEHVALSRNPVLSGRLVFTPAAEAGQDDEQPVETMFVSDQFFGALGIPLVAGSGFDRSATPDDERHVVVFSESAARAVFGTSDAVGRRVRVGNSPLNQSLEVVGVAADAVVSSPQRRNLRVVYMNFWQWGNTTQGWATLIVRANPGPTGIAQAVTSIVAGAGHEYVSRIGRLANQRDIALSQERLLAVLSLAFGMLGLTLAVVGLYGLLSFSVAQRTGEIAIRMAVGADAKSVRWLILRDALILLAVGTTIGLPLAWASNHAAATMLSVERPMNLLPLGTAVLVLLIVSLLAMWWPARRAASLDPLQALRSL